MSELKDTLDVLIAGAGQAGQAAYRQLRDSGLSVDMVDFEPEPGGELRFYPEAGIQHLTKTPDVHTRTTVVGILPPMRETDLLEVNLSAASGVQSVRVQALLVCTGQLDYSRENNRIPGQRPAGVVTPNFVMRALNNGALPGIRPVIYADSDRDIWCASQLAKAGAEVQAVLAQPGTNLATAPGLPAPTVIQSVDAVRGGSRISSVVITDVNGREVELLCDAFIYASGRYGNYFALKGSGVQLDEETGGLWTDQAFRTSIPRVYAAGTCVNPDAMHSQSEAQGRAAAEVIVRDLKG